MMYNGKNGGGTGEFTLYYRKLTGYCLVALGLEFVYPFGLFTMSCT